MRRTNRSVRAVKIGTGGGGERATWARPKSGMVPSPASLMAARQQAKPIKDAERLSSAVADLAAALGLRKRR